MKKYYSVKDKHLFSRAYIRGATHANKFTAVYVLKCLKNQDINGSKLNLGITVNKKLGKAVKRNRVKRIIREAFLKETDFLQEDLIIIIAARTAAFYPYVKTKDIQKHLKNSFSELGMYKGEILKSRTKK